MSYACASKCRSPTALVCQWQRCRVFRWCSFRLKLILSDFQEQQSFNATTYLCFRPNYVSESSKAAVFILEVAVHESQWGDSVQAFHAM